MTADKKGWVERGGRLVPPTRKAKPWSVAMPADLLDAASVKAKSEGLSIGAFIRRAVKKAVES